MKIALNYLLKVFHNEFSNLMLMYTANHDRDDAVIMPGLYLDDIPVTYQAQGKFHYCQVVVACIDDKVKLMLDTVFELKVNLPITDYDVDSILTDGITDDITQSMHDNVNLIYEMELETFIQKYNQLKKELNGN